MPDDHLYARILATAKSADQPMRDAGVALDQTVGDFGRWAMSDLISNATRGMLEEFIVAKALQSKVEIRDKWGAVRCVEADAICVEVKSSGSIQAWGQRAHFKNKFNIPETVA